MRKPSSAPLPKEKGPSLFLLLMVVTGYAMMGYAVFNIIVNPILELNWVVSVDDSDLGLPSDWGGALLFLGISVVWTLFWRFWAWKPVRLWTRRHKAATYGIALGLVSLLVVGIMLLNRTSRREDARIQVVNDSLRAIGELPEDPGAVAMRMRNAVVVVTNPTLDSLGLVVNDSVYRWIDPLELELVLLKPGRYRLSAVSSRDTLDAIDLVIPEGKSVRESHFVLFNVEGRMNFALLNFRRAFSEGKIRENASGSDFDLLQTQFGKRLFQASVRSSHLTLPHHHTLVVFEEEQALLKLVVLPSAWQGQPDKIKRYAIWSLKMEEERGLMQDGIKTIFMSESEEKIYVRDRLKREVAAFEASEN